MSAGSEIAAAAAVNATEAVEKIASRQDNGMSLGAVQNAAPELAQAIKVAIDTTPEMQNVLNTETHWWQKRSRWAFIIGAATTIFRPALQTAGIPVDEGTVAFMVDTATAIGGILTSYIALRAGIATRPLGAKPTPLTYPLNKGLEKRNGRD